MIKAVGGIIIIISCALLGVGCSNAIVQRGKSLVTLKEIFTLIKGEIRYKRLDLSEAFKEVCIRVDGVYEQMFKELFEEMRKEEKVPFELLWNNAIDKYLENEKFNYKDLVKLKSLSAKLGYLDYDMQINSITAYIDELDIDIKDNSAEAKEKCKAIKSLSVLGGIMIFIILM